MSASFRVEALSSEHDRLGFRCGEEALDRYLQTQVTQDIRRRIANCYVAIDAIAGQFAGFYTLAATSIPFTDLPSELQRKLPRYPLLPAARIGRLAVGTAFQGLGLGAALLADAAHRILHAAPAVYAIIVDAKHDRAASFYRHHGFLAFVDKPLTLFLPMATAVRAFGEE